MVTKSRSKQATSSQREAVAASDEGGSDEEAQQKNTRGTPKGKPKAAKGSRPTSSSRNKAQPSKADKEKETYHAKYFASQQENSDADASQQEDSDADADSKADANAKSKAGAKQVDESQGTY